ncbi:MAG: HAMP domain-containing sensor histidine kinase [Methylococcales bacterium]|nr:HAMP domain-containing sensor histidine kinase [Methylococcales bacterium]
MAKYPSRFINLRSALVTEQRDCMLPLKVKGLKKMPLAGDCNAAIKELDKKIHRKRPHSFTLLPSAPTLFNDCYFRVTNNLDEQLTENGKALRQATLAAEAAAQAKIRFLGIISHELMTPLFAISGFASLLSNTEIPLKQKEQAIHIADASRKLQHLFNEALTFIQLNSGEVAIEKHPFSIATLLNTISKKHYTEARSKELSVITAIDNALSNLLGDESLLEHALSLLACNAIKFTQQGSVTLSAHLLAMENGRAQLEFSVKDTGPGIPLDRQKDLFQAFEPLDSSLTRCNGGLGLGLLICLHLINLLNGELAVESSIGNGSLFRIKLWLDINSSSV